MLITQDAQKHLNEYLNRNANELAIVEKFLELIKNNEIDNNFLKRNCFTDEYITTSALILNSNKDQILLTHNAFLNKWLQLGGHFENDESLLSPAIREAKAESGINSIKQISNSLLDIDIH